MTDSIRLRPRSEADRPFLALLYASTRVGELAITDWTDEQKVAFLNWQFDAQTIHYDEYYGEADFLIVEKDGVPIGRLYVDRGPVEIEIVDIALLPQFRRGGLGTRLLREILREGEESGRPVRIYVENFNPARHLYDRLGFQHVDTNGVYHLMKWTPNAG
ncbi:MAG TPA: GNAT family N-acetyltransferase [Thermoanaerobaculia bacterium]|jgi:ribosomal protein S18 acetylase RimI-like enzyme|nr:GNAT family N-acetyltransferase [Thermoanaerobaculia bacterium]